MTLNFFEFIRHTRSVAKISVKKVNSTYRTDVEPLQESFEMESVTF